MTETSGGEVLARMLQAEGVEKVFGIIDGTYFGFYSSLHKLGIDIVTPRHESCAAHMAGASARLTGKLGVCMASNGPGVANLLPGLAVRREDPQEENDTRKARERENHQPPQSLF